MTSCPDCGAIDVEVCAKEHARAIALHVLANDPIASRVTVLWGDGERHGFARENFTKEELEDAREREQI